jgi:hypothetical protein
MHPESYRVRSARCDAPKGQPIADLIERHVRVETQVAAE